MSDQPPQTTNPAGVPNLVAAHPSLFSTLELDLYEKEVLANPKATEHEASHFFARFPKFLCLGEGSEIRREVLLYAPNGQVLGRVDFFRRTYGRRFWDIFELKTPQVSVVVKAGGLHPKLSSEVETGVSQVEDYRRILETDPRVREALLARGILVFRPDMLVVAGRDSSEVPTETLEELFDRLRRRGIRLFTYNDVFRFAKEHYLSNRIIIAPSTTHSLPSLSAFADIPLPTPDTARRAETPRFVGTFRHGLDANRRISLPAVWRSFLGETPDLVAFLWSSPTGTCIVGLTSRNLTAFVQRIQAATPTSDQSLSLDRMIGSLAQEIRLDRAGRFTLSEELAAAAGINDMVILAGALDRFEIWNPETFQQVLAERQQLLSTLTLRPLT